MFFIKKLFLKLSQYSQKSTYVAVSFLIKGDSNTGVFFANIVKLLRTPILKNICEWLLLIVFPFMLV